MNDVIEVLLKYWYFVIVTLIIYEFLRFIFKRILRRVFGIAFAPLKWMINQVKKGLNIVFGNQKIVNYELLSLLLGCILLIVYLLYTR